MTVEEITQTLQRVAENQAKHDELHERHTADVTEIVNMIAANIESLNRHDRQLDRLFELVGVLGDKHIENEQRFAQLAEVVSKNEHRFGELAETNSRLEGSYELLESFVRDFRNESRDYFAQTDLKLATLASVQMTTSDLLAAFIKETNARFTDVAESQAGTGEQIKALVLSQTRTDEMLRSLLNRNGSSGAKKAKAKKSATKKSSKKGHTKK